MLGSFYSGDIALIQNTSWNLALGSVVPALNSLNDTTVPGPVADSCG